MRNNKTNRVVQLLTILQSKGNYTTSELVKLLGISQRTFFRDLKDIRNAGIPCSFDKSKHCYAFDSKSTLPILPLSKEEAFDLLLLLHKARHYYHFPYSQAALTAALKIENGLCSEVRQFCTASLRNISIDPAPQTTMDLLDSMFTQLLEATQRRQVLNIHYSLPFEQRDTVTDLSPYHLIYAEQSWHIIGESSFHRAVHTLKLNQIKQISPLDQYFVEDKKFNLQEYFGYAWSLLREGRIYNVELSFSPEIAADVAEVQWHETQTASFEDDGSAVLRFRVDGLNEIIWWILSYGDQVEVLAPLVLRQRVAEIARRIANSSESAYAEL
jgi:predicted DNA-binding transcriptional regulator YafY